MEGSVFVRKQTRSGRTRYYVVARVRQGTRWRQRSFGGYERRRDADRAAAELRRRLGRGVAWDADRIRLADWCQRWLASGSWRPKTEAWYRHLLDRFVLPELGGVRLGELTRPMVEGWIQELRQRGAGVGSISGAHRALRAALSAAVRDGILHANPAAKLRVPAPGSRADAAWSAEELARFMAAAESSRWYPLLRFLAATGCRIGEAAGLTWDRVDPTAGRVRIDRTIVWVGTQPVWSQPKTARGIRTVAIDQGTVGVLQRWRPKLAAERLAAGPDWGAGGWAEADLVFPTPRGTPVYPSLVQQAMRRIARRAGLPDDRPCSAHVLRHTLATLALAAGEPPLLVASGLGHDPAVLLRTYAHAVPDQARLADVFARTIEGG